MFYYKHIHYDCDEINTIEFILTYIVYVYVLNLYKYMRNRRIYLYPF